MADLNDPDGSLPDRASVGDNLDWNADWEEVTLCLELPFWLLVPDCTVSVNVGGHDFPLSVTEHYCQVHGRRVTDSLETCFYQGPFPPPKEVLQATLTSGATALLRKCKTVVRISSRCNTDVCKAAGDQDIRRMRSAQLYFVSLCSAHIPIVNRLLRAYILQTYDPGVHEVAPWDVPIWFVTRKGGEGFRTLLQQSAGWDIKPHAVSWKNVGTQSVDKGTPFQFATADELGRSLLLDPTPGEIELAQAMHLRERGDYSGAVRRSVTSLEILLEDRLRKELSARYPDAEVEQRLLASRNDFPGRLDQYQALAGRIVPAGLGNELKKIRELRHSIVHRGRWLTFEERHLANRSVDCARFIFQWLENSEAQRKRRQHLLVQRQLGMHLAVFPAELTAEGVVVRGFG